MKKIRSHIFVEGKVQGVSYRAATKRIALKSNVVGWIKNLPDGRVEAVFEGDEDDVQDVIAWCRKGPDRSGVNGVVIYDEPFVGELEEFSILLHDETIDECA